MIARVVRPFVVLVALATLLGSGPVAAQWAIGESGLTDAAYTSPEFGYEVRWRSADWTPTTEESTAGSDVLQLENVAGEIVRYEATERFGPEPAACRDALLAQIAEAPGVSDLAVVPTDDGTPIWRETPALAYGFYQYRRQSGGEPGDWAAYFECRALAPEGAAVLALSHVGPAAVYDVMHAQLNQVIPSRLSVLPYAEAAATIGWESPIDCNPGRIEDSFDGATFDGGSQPAPRTRFYLVRLRLFTPFSFEQPERFDATAIALVDRNDVLHAPVGWSWGGVAGDPMAAAQEIPVGTGADLTLIYELPLGVDAASVQEWTPGPEGPVFERPLGCIAARNGIALRPQAAPVEPQIGFVMNPDGSEAGMITWLEGATLPGEGDVVVLRFTNTGAADWTVDPGAVVGDNRFLGPEPVRPEPVAVALLDPTAGGEPTAAAGPATLAPGESIDARLTFAADELTCTVLNYAAAPDQIVPIGLGPCSAGGGGLPRLRSSG